MNNHQGCVITLQCMNNAQNKLLVWPLAHHCSVSIKTWNSQEFEAQGWKKQFSETIFICRGVIICLAHALSASFSCSVCHWETCGNTAFSGKVGPTPVSLFLQWWNLLWNFCPQNASPVGSVDWCVCRGCRRALTNPFNQGTPAPAMHWSHLCSFWKSGKVLECLTCCVLSCNPHLISKKQLWFKEGLSGCSLWEWAAGSMVISIYFRFSIALKTPRVKLLCWLFCSFTLV